jgi:hypothetical protein
METREGLHDVFDLNRLPIMWRKSEVEVGGEGRLTRFDTLGLDKFALDSCHKNREERSSNPRITST